MPDDLETIDAAPPSKKSGLVADWKKLATWQKAGVLIGGAALVVAVLMFINREPAPVATGNNAVPPAENMPGQGDTFPPVPVPPVSQGTPPAPKPGPTPARPVALPPVRRAPPVRKPAPAKKTTAQGDQVFRRVVPVGKKTTAQGDQVFSHVIPVGLRGRL